MIYPVIPDKMVMILLTGFQPMVVNMDRSYAVFTDRIQSAQSLYGVPLPQPLKSIGIVTSQVKDLLFMNFAPIKPMTYLLFYAAEAHFGRLGGTAGFSENGQLIEQGVNWQFRSRCHELDKSEDKMSVVISSCMKPAFNQYFSPN